MIKKLNTFVIDLNICNQKCLFCMKADEINNGKNISFKKIVKLIYKAKSQGYKNIDFFGGEPTCYAHLKQAIQLSNKIGLNVTLATNSIKFSSLNFSRNFFEGIKIKGIRTTLHSHIADLHDMITQSDNSHSLSLEGIKNILLFNKKLSVNVVITKWNYKDLSSITKFIYNLGVKGIKFSGLVMHGRLLENRGLNIGSEKFLPYLKKSLILANSLGFSLVEIEKIPPVLFDRKECNFIKFII